MGTMGNTTRLAVALAAIAVFPHYVMANITLGTAGGFAVLAGSTVTNTGVTAIDGGHVGVSPGTAIVGFPPATIAGTYGLHANDALAVQAHADLQTAYGAAAALAPTSAFDYSTVNLGGMTLTPGVYHFSSTAQLTGTLTLDYTSNPSGQFVFQIGTALNVTDSAHILTAGGNGSDAIWLVGSSATLGTQASVVGHILAATSITLNSGATIANGSALAINGAVTLDQNSITNSVSAVPEPATLAISLLGGTTLFLRKRRAK